MPAFDKAGLFNRPRRLPRPSRERPRSRRAAKQGDERAAPHHSITSSTK